MNQESVNRVVALVRRFSSKTTDHEDLAIEILFESWTNHVEEPSVQFVRYRCIDAMRKASRSKRADEVSSRQHHEVSMPQEQETSDTQGIVDGLMRSLSPFERKVVWHRIYAERTLEDTACELKVSVKIVRETFENAVYKMRCVGDVNRCLCEGSKDQGSH